jgi:hypothetical protein
MNKKKTATRSALAPTRPSIQFSAQADSRVARSE